MGSYSGIKYGPIRAHLRCLRTVVKQRKPENSLRTGKYSHHYEVGSSGELLIVTNTRVRVREGSQLHIFLIS